MKYLHKQKEKLSINTYIYMCIKYIHAQNYPKH